MWEVWCGFRFYAATNHVWSLMKKCKVLQNTYNDLKRLLKYSSFSSTPYLCEAGFFIYLNQNIVQQTMQKMRIQLSSIKSDIIRVCKNVKTMLILKHFWHEILFFLKQPFSTFIMLFVTSKRFVIVTLKWVLYKFYILISNTANINGYNLHNLIFFFATQSFLRE